VREESTAWILGGSDRGDIARAAALPGVTFDGQLAPLGDAQHMERERLLLEWGALTPTAWSDREWYEPAFSVRGWTRLAEGDAQPVGLLGDTEPGMLAYRAAAELHGRSPWLEIFAQPEVRLDALGGDPAALDLTATHYWIGVRRGPVRVGFGAEERRLGPGRRGNLILTDGAMTWPAGTLAGEGNIWKLGRFRGEVSAGWLQRERRDVNNPGMLFMDLRWAPIPELEFGASRASMFGGEGRPFPSIGQLILPTDPHIYDDPDQLLPDQDEIAGLDGRLTIPLNQFGPLRYAEVWIEYGGEDIIALDLGSIAGVANLRGAEVAVSQAVLTVEWARMMDDLYRWYVNHRVYHEGMTQSGLSMGHPAGGDADNWWFGAAWIESDWGVQAWHERLWRVGVADVVQDTVVIYPTEERRQRYGARGWYMLPKGGHVGLGGSFEQVTGADFLPGADRSEQRVWLEWRTAPFAWAPEIDL